MLDIKKREPELNNHYEYEQESPVHPQKRKISFFFWILIALVILGIVFLASAAAAYKFYSTSRKVIIDNPPKSFLKSIKDVASPSPGLLRGEKEERINILLVGLAGENYPGENLTDSIIVASVNPKTYQTALLSIPRDLYVRIPETASYTKINALYARGHDLHGKTAEGIGALKHAVSEITGLDIHYYVAIDFDGFRQVIDELDGIKIQVSKDISDERYPGPNYSYETFEIQKGLWTLDGETALKYARSRHDEDGDFGRAFRQQQILESTRQKAFSIETLVNLPAIYNVLNILGDHLRTDIPLDELEPFLTLAKKIDTHNTVNKVLNAGHPDSLLVVSHVYLGGVRAFILIPRTGNYDEIQDVAENIFDLETIERKNQEIRKENATVAIVNYSGTANSDRKIETLLEKLGYNPKTAKSREFSSQQESMIFDNSKTKPFSLDDLSKKFSAEVISILPPEYSQSCRDADLCLIAGSDLTENLNYEENTMEELERGYDKQDMDEREYINLLKKGSSKKF